MFTINTGYFAKHHSLIGLYNEVLAVTNGINFYVVYDLGKINFWKGSTQLTQIKYTGWFKKMVSIEQ